LSSRIASIVVISGSPGTGKTTLAAHLAKAEPRGLHVPSDVFYEFPAHPVSPYRPDAQEQNVAVIAALGRTAAAFASRGYEVFLDGIFGPWFLPELTAELRTVDVAVDYVVLRAPVEIALGRVRARVGDGRDHVVRQMHAAFADLGRFGGHAVETGDRRVEEIAAEVARRRAGGEFRLDATLAANGSRDNRALIRRFYDELWNRFDATKIAALLTEDVRFRGSLGDEKVGHAGFAEYLDVVRRAFPDFTNEVVEIVSEGDRAFTRLTYRGTHRGEVLGIPPTGRRITYAGAAVFGFRDGRISEVWVLGDLHGLTSQLRNASPDGRNDDA
jgi:steroid delta-isomerase-like uncharacterized protein